MYYQQKKLPLVIKKSNKLVRTQLSVENNALSNKIFTTLIRYIDEKTFPLVSFSTAELIDTKENKGGDTYKRLKKATEILMKARLDSIDYDNSGEEVSFVMFNLFSFCKYEKGIITAKFNYDLKPHLLGLKNYFTELNYFDLIELSSFYSQRIYELLKSWENPNGFTEIKINAFYDLISYPQDLRKNFASVRRYALEQAEREINKKTELNFTWEPIKEKRKVVAIRFIIGERGKIINHKRKNKNAEKERLKLHEEVNKRRPYLLAGRECRLQNNIKPGDICKLAKPGTQKCKLCKKATNITYYEEKLF